MSNLFSFFKKIFLQRELLGQFIKREIITKYKGSYLGFFWSFMTPLFMLAIYTFVFSVVFKAKWDFGETESQSEFAIILFCGMIVYSIFSETITKSPSLIVNNPNYVKKVVFPLELLPVSLLGSALVNFLISFVVLLLCKVLLIGGLELTMIWLPVVLLPLLIYSLGLGLLLSALGVYMRDIEHTVLIIVQALYFLTPVFYPKSAVPKVVQSFIDINPLATIIENVRNVTLWGIQPDFSLIAIHFVCSLVVLYLGHLCFMKLRKGFADVI